MPKPRLEERVAALEKQVSALLADQSGKSNQKDWRRARGAFTGDQVMKEIFEEGRKIREAERKRARAGSRKKRPAHS
jgi:hypothetical protein